MRRPSEQVTLRSLTMKLDSLPPARRSPLPLFLAGALLAGAIAPALAAAPATPPNIVLIMTDDQGYGDLGCTGNPILKTPHIDRLAAESSQLTDYHVAPTCSPTRAALMTGRWTDRTGVWHTVNGRSMLRENEVTIAQMLKDRGYATGIFGKWHLGDNYPYRPQDRGFTEAYHHGAGGVGQTPDLWDNAYFDGQYFHNGRVVAAKGFCTDVFFAQAERFIRECAAKKQPFLAYITPNAPHDPLHTPPRYLEMYAGQDKAIAAFFGMIANIDDNVGRTRELLRELGLATNTLFIFTTDNGTATGEKVYNAGMRGKKGSEYEGGHRVPFFAHWPAAGWNRKYVNDTLTHAVDLAPTFLELTGATKPARVKLDGRSIRALLDPTAAGAPWPERFVVTDSQRVRDPIKWRQTAVMAQEWRLINGRELYAIKRDPAQQTDVAKDHPDQVARMRAFYDAWWAELEPTFAQTTEIYLGDPAAPVVGLNSHDWIQEALPPWNQQHIRMAQGLSVAASTDAKSKGKSPAAKPVHLGHWAVKVVRAGAYEISLRRWPVEANRPITAALPAAPDVPGASQAYRARPGVAVPAVAAVLRVDGRTLGTKPVAAGDTQITFTTTLTAGSHQLAPVFTLADGGELGAYYAVVTFVR